MNNRLTRWEGRDDNGPRAVLAKRDGGFPDNLQEALRKLAHYENEEEFSTIQSVTLKNAIRTFGEESQKKMLLEEMSELQKEICKNWRGANNTSEIAEEMADVEIMLEQMKIVFGCSDMVEKFRNVKVLRLRDRIEQKVMEEAAWRACDPEEFAYGEEK